MQTRVATFNVQCRPFIHSIDTAFIDVVRTIETKNKLLTDLTQSILIVQPNCIQSLKTF